MLWEDKPQLPAHLRIGEDQPEAMRPNRRSYGQRSSWQRKSAASFREDCQEPPYADPHVRWCGSPEGKPRGNPPGDPIGRLHHTAKACSSASARYCGSSVAINASYAAEAAASHGLSPSASATALAARALEKARMTCGSVLPASPRSSSGSLSAKHSSSSFPASA